jgi:hypothetical protein
MIAGRVESLYGLILRSSDNGPNTPRISSYQSQKAHEYMLRRTSLAEAVPMREGHAA